MNTKTASLILGIIFLGLGLLGFAPNPVVGNSHDAFFHADAVHNSVHIVTGLFFLIIALAAPSRASRVLKVFGTVYFLLGVLGLFTIGDSGITKLLRFLPVNGADNHLHIVLAVVIFLAGMLPDSPATITRRSDQPR
jgi:hypothetical protein